MDSLHDPATGDKYRCFRGQACDEVIDRLAALDRARELIAPDDPNGAAASERLRQWAQWRAEAHGYGNPIPGVEYSHIPTPGVEYRQPDQ